MTRVPGRSRLLVRGMRLVGVLAVVAGLGIAGAQTAGAFTDLTETGQPGALRLAWDDDTPPWIDGIHPGRDYHWQIRASLDGQDARRFSLTLAAEGALVEHPLGVRIAIDRCDDAFTPTGSTMTCPTGAERVVDTTRVADLAEPSPGASWDLPPLGVGGSQYFLVTVSTPWQAIADPTWRGLDGRIGFGYTVEGDDPDAVPPDRADASPHDPSGALAVTGGDPTGPALLAGGLIVLGLVQLARERRAKDGARKASHG